MLPPRWRDNDNPAFGPGETDGESILLMFETQAKRLEAAVAVPKDLTVGSGSINFYVGFNTVGDAATPLVDASASLSRNRSYGAAPPPGTLTGRILMHRDNTVRNPGEPARRATCSARSGPERTRAATSACCSTVRRGVGPAALRSDSPATPWSL